MRYYLARMDGLAQYKESRQEERQQEMEREQRGIERPDYLTKEEWASIGPKTQEKISRGAMNERAVKEFVRSRMEDENE